MDKYAWVKLAGMLASIMFSGWLSFHLDVEMRGEFPGIATSATYQTMRLFCVLGVCVPATMFFVAAVEEWRRRMRHG